MIELRRQCQILFGLSYAGRRTLKQSLFPDDMRQTYDVQQLNSLNIFEVENLPEWIQDFFCLFVCCVLINSTHFAVAAPMLRDSHCLLLIPPSPPHQWLQGIFANVHNVRERDDVFFIRKLIN